MREYALHRDDKTDDLLYVNHAFDPIYRQMHESFPNVELFFRIDDVGMLPYVLRKL
ncbi:MAG: hypothetical protein H6765_01250 [Candidatus Peribacteria bacterium]|nr:MAG: hypothetical protein H6765_01250 [Candidatus Peribacteria bacterium]